MRRREKLERAFSFSLRSALVAHSHRTTQYVWMRSIWKMARAILRFERAIRSCSLESAVSEAHWALAGLKLWIEEADLSAATEGSLQSPLGYAAIGAVAAAVFGIACDRFRKVLGCASMDYMAELKLPGRILIKGDRWIGCAPRWSNRQGVWHGVLADCFLDEAVKWWESSSVDRDVPSCLAALALDASHPEAWGYSFELFASGQPSAFVVAERFARSCQSSELAADVRFSGPVCAGPLYTVPPGAAGLQTDGQRLDGLVNGWIDVRQSSDFSLESLLRTRWSGSQDVLGPLEAIGSVAKTAIEAERAGLLLQYLASQYVRCGPLDSASCWRFRDLRGAEFAHSSDPGTPTESGSLEGIAESPLVDQGQPRENFRRATALICRIWRSVGWQISPARADDPVCWTNVQGRMLRDPLPEWAELVGALEALKLDSREQEMVNVEERCRLFVEAPEFFPLIATTATSLSGIDPSSGSASSSIRQAAGTGQLDSWVRACLQLRSEGRLLPEVLLSIGLEVPAGLELIWLSEEPFLIDPGLSIHHNRQIKIHFGWGLHGEGCARVCIKQLISSSSPLSESASKDRASKEIAKLKSIRESFLFQHSLAQSRPGLTPPLLLLDFDFSGRSAVCSAVMPCVGKTLRRLWQSGLPSGELPKGEIETLIPSQKASLQIILSVTDQLLHHLEQLEELGVVHGDIKPDNILVDEHYHAWLIDWELTLPPASYRPQDSERVCSDWLQHSSQSIALGKGSGTMGYQMGKVWLRGPSFQGAGCDGHAVALSMLTAIPSIADTLQCRARELRKLSLSPMRQRHDRFMQMDKLHQRLVNAVEQASREAALEYPALSCWIETMLELLRMSESLGCQPGVLRQKLHGHYGSFSLCGDLMHPSSGGSGDLSSRLDALNESSQRATQASPHLSAPSSSQGRRGLDRSRVRPPSPHSHQISPSMPETIGCSGCTLL